MRLQNRQQVARDDFGFHIRFGFGRRFRRCADCGGHSGGSRRRITPDEWFLCPAHPSR
jgi:hypothetical protein